MDLAPLKVFPSMFYKPPKIIRTGSAQVSPTTNKCFFCKNHNCKSELCKKKNDFKATPLGTCQMCYAHSHYFTFECNEYELYNVMCSKHESLILDQIVKSGRSIEV